MKLQLNDFDRQNVLGDGRSGKVFRAVWQKEEVALKVCDLSKHPDYEEEMLTEVEVYHALEDLQGHYIPKLKAAGYAYGKMFFLVATEIVGSPVEVNSLNDQERYEIVKALSQIHGHGFLHKDIRAENILFQHSDDGFRVSFIDFTLSKRNNKKIEFVIEMRQLKSLLGLSVS
jgi:serine/threonine protein kinase